MITENQINDLIGCDVIGSDGKKIGTAGVVYFDDATNRLDRVTVNTGLFGTNESFVPLQSADLSSGGLTVPFDKGKVKDAPNVDPQSGHLSVEDERELYRYYGMGTEYESSTPSPREAGDAGTTTTLRDAEGKMDDAMTRSEERLRVGTERQRTGRARLRKYVTPEQQTVTVPVTREEVRVEREPITDANRDEALSGPDITEDVHEVTLHEERPVVDTEAVPVERVRLEKEQVIDEEQVTGEVRKEHIEAEGTDEG